MLDSNYLKTTVTKYLLTVRDCIDRPHLKFNSVEALVLNRGKIIDKASVLPDGLKYGYMGRCYSNCQLIATKNNKLIYCEGYAASSDIKIPLPHAWLVSVDNPNVAIDITWNYEQTVYYGIAFQFDWVKKFLKNNKLRIGESVLQNLYRESSLLRNGLPEDALYF